jgi:dihydropteroate synthase
VKDTLFSIKKTLNIKGKLISLDDPGVMGIINITPDSFYSGNRSTDLKDVVRMAEKMINEGATFLDIGGYSSRPGATDISIEEELSRIIPVIKEISAGFPDCIISADTFRAEVAEKAVEAGACIINDISGGNLDENMLSTVGRLKVPFILMHMRGNPQIMQTLNHYDNLFKEITVYFNRGVRKLRDQGISDIILDVGFGFAKKIGQNYDLLKNLSYFNMFGLPLLAGISRKSMIYKTLNTTPEQALNGTIVLNTLALLKKASILRVHDVKETIEIITLLKKGRFDILG